MAEMTKSQPQTDAPTAPHPGSDTLTLPRDIGGRQVVAADVPEAEYMEKYAEHRYEWVKGELIKMTPVRYEHNEISSYLWDMLRAYISIREFPGKVLIAPFLMRLGEDVRCEPDLQVILGENCDNIQDTCMDGPADICIEIVSPGSVSTDYGHKLEQYEAGGVREYWIIDPARKRTTFNRLTDDGLYQQITTPDDRYTTPLLPNFALDLPTLWQDPLPDIGQVWQSVQTMLK